MRPSCAELRIATVAPMKAIAQSAHRCSTPPSRWASTTRCCAAAARRRELASCQRPITAARDHPRRCAAAARCKKRDRPSSDIKLLKAAARRERAFATARAEMAADAARPQGAASHSARRAARSTPWCCQRRRRPMRLRVWPSCSPASSNSRAAATRSCAAPHRFQRLLRVTAAQWRSAMMARR